MRSTSGRHSVLLLALLLSSSVLTGQTTWTGAASSNWGSGGNWSAGVPTSAVDAIIASGTPNSPSTSGVANAACRDLTVNAGASLTIAPTFQLDVSRAAAVNGAITGGGLIRFVGPTSASLITGSGTIGANVEILKSTGGSADLASNVTVNGNLTQTSGSFFVSPGGAFTMAISGNAQFQGGTLIAQNGGILDVAGNVTFSGTTVTTSPVIRCGGSWTSNAAYAPTSGLVVFDGVGAQSVTSAGTFPGVTIAATSSVTTSTSLTMNGPLAVAGSFTDSAATLVVNGGISVTGAMTMSPGTLDLSGPLTVGATGTISLGSATHTIGADLAVSGGLTATGTLVFDGATLTAITSTAALPNVQISKSAGGTVQLASNVTVNGNLTQTSGDFVVSPGGAFTMAISGNAQFQGGTLIAQNGGILDVAGNVTFSGTTVATSPVIRCGGSWTSNAAYAPTSGLVVFDGVGGQSVTSAGTFPGVTIAATSSVTTSTSLTMNGPLAVAGSFTDSAATLVVNGGISVTGAMTMSPGTLDLSGPLTVGATGTISLGSATHTIGADLAVSGGLTATGTLVFDGATLTAITSTAALPNVQISKSAGGTVQLASNVTVNGNLTQTSGDFVVSPGGAFTMAISGNAQFQGGTLIELNGGILDVAGNVTFSGTTVATSPVIRCGGSWTSNAAYAPTSGLVVFDGVGGQSVTSAGTFPGVTIAATSSVTTSTSLTMNGPLAVAGSFTDSAATLVVNGGISVTGAMTMSPGTLDLSGPLTVGATGTISLGSATHTIGADLAVSGGLTATGTLVFDGATLTAITSTAALPNVQISKSAGGTVQLQSNVTVNGNLTQTSGDFVVSPGGAFTMAISGNAQFQGGTLIELNGGILDVAGNVTFSGTTVATSPVIRCGGSWTSNAAYAPTSGLVVFDGVGGQSVTSAGTFPGVTIAATSSVTTSTSLTMNGPLAVAGSFTDSAATLVVNGGISVTGAMTMSPGTLDLSGPLTVGATGTISLGSATHTIGADLAVSGGLTATGTLVFDGATLTAITSTAALPNVQISKSAGGTVQLQSNVTVNGNLTQTSGDFVVSSGGASTMAISGNAQFQGGTLIAQNGGILDVAGNVTFSGTTVTASPVIKCAGNWTSDAAFAPASGFIELDGASPTTIAHAVPGGTLAFPTFVISNGTRTMATDFTIASSSMTIAPTGALAVAGGRHLRVHRASGATALNVNGALSVATNSELSMGPQTTATVGATGLLTLIGTAAQPAKITGEAGGGYGLVVNGSLAAKDFVVKEMGSAGMVVAVSANIAVAPNNLRSGTFDFRAGAPAGSVLLDLRRQAPAPDFDGLVFLNTPGAAGVFNVTTSPSSLPISFTNWTGAFAGPALENDPNNLVAWNLQAGPSIAVFVVRPGAELAEIVWHTTSSLNVTGYEIRRANSLAGPFSIFVTTPNTGSSYGFIDSPLPANQAVFYAGYAVMSGGDVLLIGTGSATPYSSATPGNIKKVGGNGTFTTIQGAIDAATDPNSVVWVTPGTYDAFTIGATAVASNLRILGDDTAGPVIISTTNGPIQIMNVPASSGVELSNLTVGSATTAQNGIVITNCACPVVLDEVDVSCDGAHTAILVSASASTAIQRSDVQGGTGLAVSNASYVAISRGSLSSLTSTGSTIEVSTLTPGSVNVTPAGSLFNRPSLMPEINIPEFIKLSLPSAMFLSAQPNAPYVLGASPRLGFQTGSFEMPFLLDPVAFTQLPMMFTDGFGNATIGFEVEPIAALLGFSFTVQVVVGDPVTGASLLSNVESMVCIP